MKNWITTLLTLIGILILNTESKAQDYNDIGRTKKEELSILKYNGFKVERIYSNIEGKEIYSAKRLNQNSQYENVITFDKKTGLVESVVWNFDAKNYEWIKSLLTDMKPTDSTNSQLENNKGYAQLTLDPINQGSSMIVWKKKS